MLRQRTLHWLRTAAWGAVVSLAFGSVAWGQEWGQYDNRDSYYRNDEARERGYQRGFRDGMRAGQNDSERGRRFKFKNDDWEDSRGFKHWMGDKREYKYAYRDGYERGYRRAYRNYGDQYDDRYRDRDDWR